MEKGNTCVRLSAGDTKLWDGVGLDATLFREGTRLIAHEYGVALLDAHESATVEIVAADGTVVDLVEVRRLV